MTDVNDCENIAEWFLPRCYKILFKNNFNKLFV